MELKIINTDNKLNLADSVFDCVYNEALIHQIVTAYQASGRSGTKSQKTRAEVRGGGAKPWKQKGTGRARAGTNRSPLWRKGGVIFAAKPRSFKQKVNKKMYKGALCSILSELLRQERLGVMDELRINNPKTKELIQKINEMKLLNGNILFVTDQIDENLYLAARNLPHVELKNPKAAMSDPVTLLSADHVVMTQAAIEEIEGLLK